MSSGIDDSIGETSMPYLDIIIVLGETIGLVLASLENGLRQFVYYT